MKIWKRNLIVCWFGTFVTGLGMSQIAPIMPLYIRQLGVHNTSAIEQISGIAFWHHIYCISYFFANMGRCSRQV